MIRHACPVVVLDDQKEELWKVSHGLSVCGLPIMQHLVVEGALERQPPNKYEGVRFFFTDLHLLGLQKQTPEQCASALVSFLDKLINPSTYLIVFWSAFPEDAKETWDYLVQRLKTAKRERLIPFDYRVLDKELVKLVADDDPNVAAKAAGEVKSALEKIMSDLPQLVAIMNWESSASRAASATSNELIGKLAAGGFAFTEDEAIKATLKRMSQEALGLPHAPKAPTKGVYQALTPIVQDWLNKEAERNALDSFLQLTEETSVPLPHAAGKPTLPCLLNDFFIHSEQPGLSPYERGAVIRLPEAFLCHKENGLISEIGLAKHEGDWREAICIEFAQGFVKATDETRAANKNKLDPKNIYAVELSADCDYAQDKVRSHRYLLSLFVPTSDRKPFYQSDKPANDAIYVTQEITLEGVSGRLLVSCRIFLTRPYKGTVEGTVVTRLRQDVLSELAHYYSTHMRRPGKIAFR